MNTQQLKTQVRDEMVDQEGVTGVGIGEDEDGEEVVVINVEHGASDSIVIPQRFSTENVEIRETGSFHMEVVRQGGTQQIDRKAEHRPVPGGVSAGHTEVTAGTVGFIVEDSDGNRYTSSNNHVYANVNAASEGDEIIQPGTADGGTTNNVSATLAGYVPIENGATLDFAWADMSVEHLLELEGVGKPSGSPVDVSVGDTLIKSGRTTSVTEGTVEQISVDVNVGYGDGNTYTMNDCILTGDMSDGGDSGSAVLVKDTMEPAGVLFAGSNTSTLLSKATNIKPETGLTIVTDGGSGGGGGGDQTPTASVSITLQKETPETGNIQVTVTDQNGNSVSGATVSADGPSSLSGTTDTSGSVSFDGVQIGEWSITAQKSGYSTETVSVASGDFN